MYMYMYYQVSCMHLVWSSFSVRICDVVVIFRRVNLTLIYMYIETPHKGHLSNEDICKVPS